MKDYTDFQIDRLEDLYRNFKNTAFEDINHEFPRLFKELRNVCVFNSILSELKINSPISQKEMMEWNENIWNVRQNQIYRNYSQDKYVSLLLHWCDYLLDNNYFYDRTSLNELTLPGLEGEKSNKKKQNYFKECIVGKIIAYIKRKFVDSNRKVYHDNN